MQRKGCIPINKKRILVTGVTSIHGWPVFRHIAAQPEYEVYGIRSPKMKIPEGQNLIACCITDEKELLRIKKDFNPTDVIHAAGVCDLDVCEDRPEWAEMLNTLGACLVATIFGESARISFLSSDLVFAGEKTPICGYDDIDIPDPISVAGKTIYAAEKEVIQRCQNFLILRLGLPIGRSLTGTKGAVDFVEHRLKRSLQVTLFIDELRSCIACEDIAEVVRLTIARQITGSYNLGGPRAVSLYDIGRWVLQQGNYDAKLLKGILRCEEAEGPPRMGNVALNSTKIETLFGYACSAPIPVGSLY